MENFYAKAVYTKTGLSRYTSHRDIIEIIKKAAIKAGLPVVYSKGYNPRPGMSFFNPLQVGISSKCEICVMQLSQYIKPAMLLSVLNRGLPDGMEVIEIDYIRSRKAVTILSSQYSVDISIKSPEAVMSRLAEIKHPEFTLIKARSGKEMTVHDKIADCRVEGNDLLFTLDAIPGGSISPLEFLKLFFDGDEALKAQFRTIRKNVKIR